MKIFRTFDQANISKGIECLTNEFIGEYPYYKTWVEKTQKHS